MKTLQTQIESAASSTDKVLFRKQVQRELDEIRGEVTTTCALVSEVEPVPESAYAETLSLLEQIPRNIPMPDMMWLEDGEVVWNGDRRRASLR